MKLLFNTILKYKFTILILIILCSICVIYNYHIKFTTGFFIGIISALFSFFIINIISKIKYPIILIIPFIFFIALDLYFAVAYSESISMGIMASIIETNWVETKSVMSDPTTLITAITAILVTTSLTLLSVKELKHCTISIKSSLIILFAYLFLIVPIYFVYKITQNKDVNENFRINKLYIIQELGSIVVPIIYGDILTFMAYRQEINTLNSYKTTKRDMPSGINKEKQRNTPEKIYLILGESSSRDYYSLYGYNQPTTPFLDSLNYSNLDGFKYYEAVAPASSTRESIKISLSFATPKEGKYFYEYYNLVEMAKLAGYETFWISNQILIGFFETYIGFISSCADYSFFDNDMNRCRDDLNLVKVLNNKYENNKKQLFIIHLQGSHMRYSDKIDDIDREAIKDNTTFGDYARTIHHTDRVLKEIYKIARRDSSSIMYYFSDHAEVVGKGHGFVTKGGRQFEVPLVTISTPDFSKPLDSIVNKYKVKEGFINNVNTIYILSEIMGYTIDESNIKKALNDSEYILHTNYKNYRYSDLEKGID